MKKIMSGIGFKFGPTEVNSSSRNDTKKINSAEPDEKDNTGVDFQQPLEHIQDLKQDENCINMVEIDFWDI